MGIVDLHCHTRMSDSSRPIEEVIARAKEVGVDHLAITDHDTTAGLHRAIEIGRAQGVNIVPGIEISAYDFARGRRAHLLGLYVEPGHPALEAFCRPMRERRHRASFEMVGKLQRARYEITWEEVQRYARGGTGVYKQHIMHALIDRGYAESIYGPLYKRLFSRGENGQAGIAYTPVVYLDAREAIAAIRAAGGVPVLAHPGQFDNFAAVEEWVEAGLAGIEVYHPLHGPEEERRAKELARRFDLVITGGSDDHGFYGDPSHTLGCRDAGEACIDALQKRLRAIRG
ncbi:PHP domain-containing protein [Kyrpidia spormannii]|uniref:Phosphoribosyl 1,2-cyclic phosphate 1,2-diphosphodiesterase n=1 Tax=Kyrpidia spormannii TaxID=2055160 RepID=A0A6F9EIK5_9BACL|nr:PHP domain-containing protein [Kyrpidia spormannii]CAB3396124.1 Phosphoribosyl 1,2-cyclic phosphate 1,2-diphosphodiesterase [Kyrpidia spormannii]